MTVEEAKRGLRVTTVYEGSPAAEGGLKKGDLITEVNGRSIAGSSSRGLDRAHQGPGRHQGPPHGADAARARDVELKRAQVDIPVVESDDAEARRRQEDRATCG